MKLNLRQIRLIFVGLIIAVLAAGVGFWLGQRPINQKQTNKAASIIRPKQPQEEVDFGLFWEVWDRLKASFVDQSAFDTQKMVYGAIKGMTAALGDPYTVFLSPEENKRTKEDLNGAFGGIGIELGYKDQYLAVISPLKGTPAERAGLKAGDLILKIEDQEAMDISLPEAVELIRGRKGTEIKMTLIHQKEAEPYEVTIVRETIVVPSVEVEFVGNLAWLKLTRFGDRTTDEWQKAVRQIIQQKPSGIIFDLRVNSGGYLSGSVYIASEFLKKGEVVVQQQNADGGKETFSVDRDGQLISQPLVILVNEGSASASEIVAGALRDHQRAKLVGQKTFGKGSVQEAQDLDDKAGLHVTVARWLLPSGDWIDKKGIDPDVKIENNPDTEIDEQLETAEALLQ